MEDLIKKWKREAEGYNTAENDTELAFHTRAMAKHKKEVFQKCAYDLEQCVGETTLREQANELLPLVSQRSELLAFAKEMQKIGFNEMDDAEKVVDIYIKANCG